MTLRLLASLTFALAATLAHAQASAPLVVPQADSGTTVLPIWSNDSGKVEALLLIESADSPRSTLDRLVARRGEPAAGAGISIPMAPQLRLDARLTLEANPTVGLLCEGRGVTIGSLSEHCLLAELGAAPASSLGLSRPGVRAEARLQGDQGSLGAQLGLRRYELGSPLDLPGAARPVGRDPVLAIDPARVEQHDVGVIGQLKLGTQGWVNIGGTYARARLIPAAQLPGGLPPEWNTGTLTVGGGVGNFGGELTTRSIDVPGQPRRYTSVGLGVTWRTPWRALLSVGAENLVTRGKNPFGLPDSAIDDKRSDERIPYVRYEQDL